MFIPDNAIFSTSAADPTKRPLNESIGSLAFQIMFVNFLNGTALGAIDTALSQVHLRKNGQKTSVPDYIADTIGNSITTANASFALSTAANRAFGELVADIDENRLTPERRGEIADLISQAKVASDAAALSVMA